MYSAMDQSSSDGGSMVVPSVQTACVTLEPAVPIH